MNASKQTFKSDLDFLKRFGRPVVLSDPSGRSQLIISPDHQGRIMTSTAGGINGNSYGWINYDLIESGKLQEHINAFGGEDRLWLGPEAGQFALYFKPHAAFNFENYQVPLALDIEPFELVEFNAVSAELKKETSLVSYANVRFQVTLRRKIRLFSPFQICSLLDIDLSDDLNMVGFESENSLMNRGDLAWQKSSGLISIWILGMLKANENTSVIIPVQDEHGRINSNYFGELDSSRLSIKNSSVFFKGDGNYRSKIGIPSSNAKSLLGSRDPENNLLTIVQFSFAEGDYVNSLWEIQKDPFDGDVVNAYNDGPLNENGKQLGKFYELETSSPAKELKPGESITHLHRTFHFEGEKSALQELTKKLLGTNVD